MQRPQCARVGRERVPPGTWKYATGAGAPISSPWVAVSQSTSAHIPRVPATVSRTTRSRDVPLRAASVHRDEMEESIYPSTKEHAKVGRTLPDFAGRI